MHQSRLIDEKPETYKSVAQYLVKVSSELDHFKRLALAELPKQTDGRKVPRCFPTRCDMIKEEMQKLSQGLANKSLPPSVGSLLTEIFAVQVGRLTLDGYSHSSTDNLPEIMERRHGCRTDMKQFDWAERNVIDHKGQLIIRHVHPIFIRLNQVVPRCYCVQCTNRARGREYLHTRGE